MAASKSGTGLADVLDHLRARGLAWREDPTNADPSFLRNRVRAELLPYLEARFNAPLLPSRPSPAPTAVCDRVRDV